MQGSWENSNSAFQETIRKAVSGRSFMFTVYPVQVELWAILDAHHVENHDSKIKACQNSNWIFNISVFSEKQSDLTEYKDQRSAYL